jgi:hypothetical protein
LRERFERRKKVEKEGEEEEKEEKSIFMLVSSVLKV